MAKQGVAVWVEYYYKLRKSFNVKEVNLYNQAEIIEQFYAGIKNKRSKWRKKLPHIQ